ncbi:hypothetical protein CDAR_387461 [Caerostris darwini]|uniref:Uncharacterized protein n=1 Tax=Caerostris darwini TaxID=1538125 RepID=A0AAV4MML5_9ARAC|nr:hypothetical protein CDAR_387461 [Caerostris darwini]
MSFNRDGPGRKRSQSLPATSNLLKNNGISEFLRRRSTGSGESSTNVSKGKKRSGSLMEPIQEEIDHLREILPIPFEKPKPKYRTDFPRPEVFPEETWKERLVRILREGARRIVSFFQD